MSTRRTFLQQMIALNGVYLVANPFQTGLGKSIMENKTGISYLTLASNKLAEQEIFYSKILELPVTRLAKKQLKVQAGATEIIFYESPGIASPIYHFAFNIPENKLNDAMVWLKKKGVTLWKREEGTEVFHFPNWNAHSCYWFDKSGNILEFIARHDLPNASEKAFSPAGILYASEIGLVVDNVTQELKTIQDKLGLGVYKTSSEVFAAVGNEHNLLILVKKNRIWLGSSSAALPYPVSATLGSGTREAAMSFDHYPFTIKTRS